jgi:putative FmdB family regulatory protein
MPIYEYKCSACRHELEAIQKFADAPLVTCPACGKDALTKLVSAAGFQLKGSGWYQTYFKGSGAKPAAKTDAPKAEAGKAEAGKDAAPADGGKATESKPSAPVTPPATSSSTPAAGV